MLNTEQDFIRFLEVIETAAREVGGVTGEMPTVFFVSWDMINRFPEESIKRLETLLDLQFIVFHQEPIKTKPGFNLGLLESCISLAVLAIIGLWLIGKF